MNKLEHKTAEFEIKDISDSGTFVGYGSVFNTVDQGRDKIVGGAFTKSLKAQQDKGKLPKMLWQHDPGQPIGVWTSMKEDNHGLLCEGRLLTDLQRGNEAHKLMQAGALDGLSIGYRTLDSDYDGKTRVLKELDLLEVSVVTFPMHQDALVTNVKHLGTIRDVEHILRDAGVPKAFAKLVAIHGYEGAKQILEDDQRDADPDEAKRQREELVEAQRKLKALLETLNG
jgi:HK97 family phage prohead protease